jgi:hypothetical protein
VLVLDLGVEEDLVVELRAEVQDEAEQIDARVGAGGGAVLEASGGVRVERFAVAADRDALLDPVDLRADGPSP